MRPRFVLRSILLAGGLAVIGSGPLAGPAAALSCGETYTVRSGDSLSHIAAAAYGTGQKWSAIYYANQKTIGEDAHLIHPGQNFRIPCLDGSAQTAEGEAEAATGTVQATSARSEVSIDPGSERIRLLTADDYRPFTDRALPKGGMITDIIQAALGNKQSEGGPAFKVNWVNDWSAHLDPLLTQHSFDLGFPWFQPNCKHYDQLDEPAKFRCDKLSYSEPVFEILVLFFTRRDSQFQFTSDEDVNGKRICRPAGYFTFDLDKDGRNWVKDDKIVLMRPKTTEDCFRMLADNEVDAVALNEFTGRAAVKKLDMTDTVRVIERPVSLLGLHVIVAKTHPKAKAYIELVNDSLAKLRKSGRYDQIVDKHLSVFWKDQES